VEELLHRSRGDGVVAHFCFEIARQEREEYYAAEAQHVFALILEVCSMCQFVCRVYVPSCVFVQCFLPRIHCIFVQCVEKERGVQCDSRV
jgi:hypothetical protein